MRKSLPIVILAGVITAITFLVLTARPQAADDGNAAKPIQKWEYRSGGIEGVEDLNKVGEDGWEVCAMSFNHQGAPARVWLKRPKSK